MHVEEPLLNAVAGCEQATGTEAWRVHGGQTRGCGALARGVGRRAPAVVVVVVIVVAVAEEVRCGVVVVVVREEDRHGVVLGVVALWVVFAAVVVAVEDEVGHGFVLEVLRGARKGVERLMQAACRTVLHAPSEIHVQVVDGVETEQECGTSRHVRVRDDVAVHGLQTDAAALVVLDVGGSGVAQSRRASARRRVEGLHGDRVSSRDVVGDRESHDVAVGASVEHHGVVDEVTSAGDVEPGAHQQRRSADAWRG